MTTEQTSPWFVLAFPTCQTCGGSGLSGADHCACVLRRIARAVHAHVHNLQARIGSIQPLALDSTAAPQGKRWNGIVSVDYISDVYNTARRVLSDVDFTLWKHHCLKRHPWHCCCPKLGINRGVFFHRLYDIEERVGRTFLQLAPYPLFPIHCYTDTRLDRVRPCPVIEDTRPGNRALRPPLAPRAPRKPAPAPMPAPRPPLDPAEMLRLMKKRFRAGKSLHSIATELTRLTPAPNGPNWRACDVRAALLNAPRDLRPRLRKAA